MSYKLTSNNIITKWSMCVLVRWEPGIYIRHITLSRVYEKPLQWCAESLQGPNTLLYCQLCWHYTR